MEEGVSGPSFTKPKYKKEVTIAILSPSMCVTFAAFPRRLNSSAPDLSEWNIEFAGLIDSASSENFIFKKFSLCRALH